MSVPFRGIRDSVVCVLVVEGLNRGNHGNLKTAASVPFRDIRDSVVWKGG